MNIEKSLDVMFYIAKKSSRELTDVKLMKLMYFSDKKALLETGFPITDDSYYLMNRGPILSSSLDHLNSYSPEFSSVFEKPEPHQDGSYPVKNLTLKTDVSRPLENLAEIEIDILDAIIEKMGHMTTNETVNFAHSKENCPEWSYQFGSSKYISIPDLLRFNGVSSEEAQEIASEIEYYRS
jgi:uncharacterized phage-associated protein